MRVKGIVISEDKGLGFVLRARKFSHLFHIDRVGVFLVFWGLLKHALGYSPSSRSFDASMVWCLRVVLFAF